MSQGSQGGCSLPTYVTVVLISIPTPLIFPITGSLQAS